ncbi:hypothetical protein BOX15_Mlig022047g1, partial [Macrostomum lignano]
LNSKNLTMTSKLSFGICSCLLGLTHFLSAVQGAGYLQIRFNRYTNHEGRVEDGSLCDPFGATYVGDNCDPVFRLRVNKGGEGGGNLHDYQQPGVYDNQNTIDFGSKFGSVPNPVPIAMNFPNPGHAYVKVDVVDKDTFPPDDPMSKFTASLPLIADNVRRDMELTSPARHHRLSMTHWFTCYTNFYGQDCNTYCVAQNDDVNGHYTCDSNGRRVCMIGFTGTLCNEDIDECLMSSPCSNESTCVNTIGNFKCMCPPGFEGRLCDEDINECSESPPKCRNGGNCTNTVGSFRCTCPTGLTGRHCEQDIDECKLAAPPCRNNGSCQNSFGGFSCRCGPAFRGRRCEIRAEASVGSPTEALWKLPVIIVSAVLGTAIIAVIIALVVYQRRNSSRGTAGYEDNESRFDNEAYAA